jgi:hypothetical protein
MGQGAQCTKHDVYDDDARTGWHDEALREINPNEADRARPTPTGHTFN